MGKFMISCIIIAMFISAIGGYVGNIIKLVKCDFEPTYKAEIIRSVGVVIPVVGMIAGYCDIEDKPKGEEN